MKRTQEKGLQPAATAPREMQERFRGYVVDPKAVADALFKRLAVQTAARAPR